MNCILKDTVVSQTDGTEVQQGRRTGQQQQPGQQNQPGQRPDGHASQQPLLGHLATLGCEQGQLRGRVAADPTGLAAADEQDQGVQRRQGDGGHEVKGDKRHGAPAALLTRTQ